MLKIEVFKEIESLHFYLIYHPLTEFVIALPCFCLNFLPTSLVHYPLNSSPPPPSFVRLLLFWPSGRLGVMTLEFQLQEITRTRPEMIFLLINARGGFNMESTHLPGDYLSDKAAVAFICPSFSFRCSPIHG